MRISRSKSAAPPMDLAYLRTGNLTTAKGPLPDKLKVTFNYGDHFTLNATVSGVPDDKVFSANGVYDPDITGVGHQPRAFDQLMALYDHAVVIGVKITCWFHSAVDTNSIGYFAVLPHDNSTVFTDKNDILEHRGTVMAQCGLKGQTNDPVILQINPNQFLGRSSPLSDPDLKNTIASNPTEQAYLHCYGWSPSSTAVIVAQVRIEYTCILIEPKLPPIS